MTWLSETDGDRTLRDRAAQAVHVQLGLAHPLWLAYGAVASAGAAWWLMTRWPAPVNLEALAAAPAPEPVVVAPPEAVEEPAAAERVAVEAPLSETPVFATPIFEAPALETAVVEAAVVEAPTLEVPVAQEEPVAAPVVEAAWEPVETSPEAPAEPPAVADDLTLIAGVGPRSAQNLAAHGVTTFAALAAWTEDQMAAFDAEMKLKGRSLRDAWQDQARALATQPV